MMLRFYEMPATGFSTQFCKQYTIKHTLMGSQHQHHCTCLWSYISFTIIYMHMGIHNLTCSICRLPCRPAACTVASMAGAAGPKLVAAGLGGAVLDVTTSFARDPNQVCMQAASRRQLVV